MWGSMKNNSDAGMAFSVSCFGVRRRAGPGQEKLGAAASRNRDAKEDGIQVVIAGDQSPSTQLHNFHLGGFVV